MDVSISKSNKFRRFNLVVIALILLLPIAYGGTAVAAPKPVTPCLTPTGIDLNARYGISAAIIAPFCPVIESGRQWTVAAAWFVGYAHDAVPAGYIPFAATPADDFVSKFVAVRWVIDPGTASEKSYVFGGAENLGIVAGDEFIGINSVTLGTAKPLSVGTHQVVVYWTLTALHCDGLGESEVDNCLPAGEFVIDAFEIEVTSGHHG